MTLSRGLEVDESCPGVIQRLAEPVRPLELIDEFFDTDNLIVVVYLVDGGVLDVGEFRPLESIDDDFDAVVELCHREPIDGVWFAVDGFVLDEAESTLGDGFSLFEFCVASGRQDVFEELLCAALLAGTLCVATHVSPLGVSEEHIRVDNIIIITFY